MKKDKSVEVALESIKLTDSCLKLRPHKPNMEEVSNHKSNEILRAPNETLSLSKTDLECAWG